MRQFVFAFLVLLPAFPAFGVEPLRFDLRVTSVALGSRVFDIDASASIDRHSYLVEAVLKTAGVVDALARGEGVFKSLGKVGAQGLKPERFTVRSVGNAGERLVELAWDAFGLALVDVKPPPSEEDRETVAPEQLPGTRDLASAVLEQLMPREAVDPCSGTLRIFDGRRRYDLHLQWGADDILKPHRHAAYAGPAKRCLARHERIAGYLRQYEERNRNQPSTVYTIWLIELPARKMYLPVRLRSEAWFGSFNAYVTSAKANGAPILPELPKSE